jgi:iron complex outermembrane receptor protein
MSIFCSDGRFASSFSCTFHTPPHKSEYAFTADEPSQATTNRSLTNQRWLRRSAAPLDLLASLCFGPATSVQAQTATQTAQGVGNLEPVVVTEPQRKPAKRTQAASTPFRTSARTTKRPAKPAVPVPTTTASPASPLNTNAVASSANRLGLAVREIPATIEVIDQKTIRDQGYRTTTEVAQGTVGVTGGAGGCVQMVK